MLHRFSKLAPKLLDHIAETVALSIGSLPPARLPLIRHIDYRSLWLGSPLHRSKFRHSRLYIPALFEWWKRREEVGPEKPRHRSNEPNWNFDAELYAFGKRLGENLTRATLVEVLTEKSTAEAEAKRQASMSAMSVPNSPDNSAVSTAAIASNIELARRGERLARQYAHAFLRHLLPAYPDDGIAAVCDFLMSDELCGYVGQHLGLRELILSTEFPLPVSSFATATKALIGAIERDESPIRAAMFVQDFILTQLSGRNINQFWKIDDPKNLLVKHRGGRDVEPRIIWKTGESTPMAAYEIGIYDKADKSFIGRGAGETVQIAQDMALRNALYRLFGTDDSRAQLLFSKQAASFPEKLVPNFAKNLQTSAAERQQ